MVDPTGFVEGDRPPHASLHTPAQRIACPAAHSGAGWTAIRAATVAVAVAVALSGVPRAAAADNALLKKIGNAWTSGTLSWCMAASMKLSDIKKLRSDSEGMTGPELAVAKEKPCKQHIDDWCELRFGDSKDVCKRTYLALMPVGDNLSAGPGESFDPIQFLELLGGWHGAKAKFQASGTRYLMIKGIGLPAEDALTTMLNHDETLGLKDLSKEVRVHIINSVMMRLAADVRKVVEDFGMTVGTNVVVDHFGPDKKQVNMVHAVADGVVWGAEGSTGVTSDLACAAVLASFPPR